MDFNSATYDTLMKWSITIYTKQLTGKWFSTDNWIIFFLHQTWFMHYLLLKKLKYHFRQVIYSNACCAKKNGIFQLDLLDKNIILTEIGATLFKSELLLNAMFPNMEINGFFVVFIQDLFSSQWLFDSDLKPHGLIFRRIIEKR